MNRRLTGKLIDVNGREGTAEVVFRGTGLGSTWKVVLPVPGHEPLQFESELQVEWSESRISMNIQRDLGNRTITAEIKLTAEKSARPAFLGRYRVNDPGREFPISAGVIIFWIA